MAQRVHRITRSTMSAMLRAARRCSAAIVPQRTVRALSTKPPLLLCAADTIDPTVQVLTLNQPDSLNAMSVGMGEAVEAAVASLQEKPPEELRSVLITGAGRAFSAGGDLAFLEARRLDNPTNNYLAMKAFYKRFLCIQQLPVPVVCCINGPAIGAGLSFAMAADLRVTHDEAKLGLTFVGLGLHPGMGSTHLIAAAANAQAANRLLLTGDIVSGAEAQSLGLVAQSLPDRDAALDAALALARRIAKQSPLAVRATVRTLRNRAHATLDAALENEAYAQAASYASADYAEGLAAVVAKRKPQF